MTRSDLIDLAPPLERAFLIAVETGNDEGWTAEDSLAELASLADTAGADVVGAEWQRRRHIDPNWYLGKGKAAELKTAKAETGFTLLVADDELSPNQQRALEELLTVKVLDRSGLILDIFAQHAQTHEGRLQVELAQLQYQLPRLTRMWTHLSRTGGGIGTRGPGETQLETDRRVIRVRIAKLKERVEQVRQQRETAGRSRDRRLVPSLAIVGYTNAGKSSLLNALTGREAARAEDRLFATLDPTSRQVKLGDGQSVVLTDTVGFIHKLPHQLVEAFRATLEEVTRADVLIEVVDGSDAHAREHRQTVQEVLDELGRGPEAPHRGAQQGRSLRPGGAARRCPRAGRRGGGAGLRADWLRAGHAPRADLGAAGGSLGGRRRDAALCGGRAAGPGPRARYGGRQLPGRRGAGDRSGHPLAGRRAARCRPAPRARWSDGFVSQPVTIVCRPTPTGFLCEVTVGRDAAATHHGVSVSRADLARLAPGHYDPERLVAASFDFLLAREPREAILRSFDLPVIERYFPGYEAAMRDLLGA